MLALVASVLGAGTMTGLSIWLIWIIWKGGWAPETAEQRLGALAYALYGTVAIIGITISAFGLAINPRKARGKIGIFEFEISGGDEDEDEAPKPVATVQTTTVVSAPASEETDLLKMPPSDKYGD